MKKLIIKIIIIISLLILYAFFIEPNTLKTKEQSIKENISESFNGLKLVHISDLHYRNTTSKKFLNKIKEEINLINPDILVFTGDLVDKSTTLSEEDISILENFLKSLNSKYGKYSILGNHDNKKRDELTKIYAHSNFILLINNYNIIYNEENDKILLAGLDTASYNKQDETTTLKYLEDNPNTFSILLLHEPDYTDTVLNNYNPNIILAGHSHGGQVRLPIIGKLYTPKLSKKYYDNYYKINNTSLYISSGLGQSKLNVRFFNPPSISFYRITNN